MIVIGGALCIYGIIFGVKSHSFAAPAAVPIALGLLDVLLGLIIVTCGYKRLFFLRLFMLANGLITLGEFTAAILFMVPDTRQKIIDAMGLSDDVLDWVTNNVSAAGYILLVMVAIKAVAVVLVGLQACQVNRSFEEGEEEDAQNLLKTSDTGYGMAKVKKEGLLAGDKFGALGDEGETAGAAARYRERNAAMYEKYGLGATRK